MGVPWGTSKSSFLMGFSLRNHPAIGVPPFMETPWNPHIWGLIPLLPAFLSPLTFLSLGSFSNLSKVVPQRTRPVNWKGMFWEEWLGLCSNAWNLPGPVMACWIPLLHRNLGQPPSSPTSACKEAWQAQRNVADADFQLLLDVQKKHGKGQPKILSSSSSQ